MTSDEIKTGDVSNEDIYLFLKQIEDEQKKVVILSSEEVSYIKEMIKERQAFNIVFRKGKVLLSILAGIILAVVSFMIDWHHLKTLLKAGV